MTVSDADVSEALLVSTLYETYPESDEVLTTDLAPPALEASLQLINKAKHQTETDIQGRSQYSSSDVEEWITQAKRLQQDIVHSKAVAREIVKEYEEFRNLSARLRDAEAKVELLQNEISFNQAVTLSLEDSWSVDKDLTEAEAALAGSRLTELPTVIEKLSLRNERMPGSNAKKINGGRLMRIQQAVVEGLTAAAQSMVEYQRINGRQQVTVSQGYHESLGFTFDHLLEALEKLRSLDDSLQSFSKVFDRRICQQVLSGSAEAVVCSIDPTSHCLTLSPSDEKKVARNVLDCLSSVFLFLHAHFPQRLGSAIGTKLSEQLLDTLIRDWLTPSIPLNLSHLQQVDDIRSRVRELAELISSYRWPGHRELTVWMERLPQTWLDKRRASALDAVRQVFKARRMPNREVERVERHNITRDDEAFVQNGVSNGNASLTDAHPETTAPLTELVNKEEEDLSAWDLDDETENNGNAVASPTGASEDVEHGSDGNSHDCNSRTGNAAILFLNGSTKDHQVTLTETYIITDIPDHLLDIISREVQDAERMKASEFAAFEGIFISAGLQSLPTLILALFRATAPAYYTSKMANGNMHLYNDCIYVAEKLRNLAQGAKLKLLLDECHVLERFARSAYAKEMDIQRTVLGDLLDGAQGFVNCTIFPNSTECENAVSSTIDRLRTVHHEWSSILSRSALLQSSGSLLSSVIEKIVKDIEDMEDISEGESQRLAAFCGRFTALEHLFMPEGVDRGDAEAVPLTAVYVSNWLRFQYLSNILESSLVDIKYLWVEGELSLEFTADEVVELIEALFAESSHRRNAIVEIRRSRP